MKKTGNLLLFVIILSLITGCAPKGNKITFDSQGGSKVNSIYILTGTKITLPQNPTKEGFTFAGWFTLPEGNGTHVTNDDQLSNPITVYAKWLAGVGIDIPIEGGINITFDLQNDTTSMTRVFAPGSKIEFPNIPIKSGYIFDGWYDDKEITHRIDESYIINQEKTIYAKWKPDKNIQDLCEINFNLDGGDIATNNNPEAVLQGDTPQLYSRYTPTKSGYTFGGWFTERNGKGTHITTSTIINKSMTVYAYWTTGNENSNNKIKVKLVYQYSDIVKTMLYADGENFENITLTFDGYVFLGWFTQESGGTRYTSDTKITSDITLYAQWKKGETSEQEMVKVYFELNGGNGNNETKTIKKGTTIDFPSPPTKEGYNFVGWFRGNQEYTKSTSVDFSITLTAKWTQINPEPPEEKPIDPPVDPPIKP